MSKNKEVSELEKQILDQFMSGQNLFGEGGALAPLQLSAGIATSLYILTTSLGYIALLMAGIWMSRLLRNNLMDDVFNNENESFQQETKLMENETRLIFPRSFTTKVNGTMTGLT